METIFRPEKILGSELTFENVEKAKASIMKLLTLWYKFYDEALENLNRYLKKYPANKNVIYAHYLIAIIF